jgi:hypothetical protein
MNMRKSIVLLSALFVAGGASSFGAVPVARVISAQQVIIDGIAAPPRNYVPVSLGGDVNTLSASALLQFPDGSTIELQPNSELRISGAAGKPVVRVVHGSAQYKMTPNSSIRFAGGDSSDTAKKIGTANIGTYALAQIGNMGRYDAALVYGASAGQSAGVVAPSGVTATGSMAAGTGIQGVFFSNPHIGSSGPQIILPGGGGAEVLNLTASTNPTTGVVTYTVASITQTVILPGGGTTIVTVSSNNFLIGTTVGGITGSTPSGATAQISFTPPGTTTPLPPATVSTAITAVQTTAVSQSPAGSTAPVATSVSTGTFSSSAS